jgi:Fe2+ transport system protein FeoA
MQTSDTTIGVLNMRLYDLDKNDKGIIVAINGCREFKKRLLSLGITRESKFTIKEISMARNTFKVAINTTLVALRKGEAMKIEVEKTCEK